jgi:phage shock protein PspC (stress-responsive transcriptional regulator)
MKHLYLSEKNKKIGGVFGGIGEYFRVDPTLLRIVWILITIFSGVGPGIVVYVLAWIVIPALPVGKERAERKA